MIFLNALVSLKNKKKKKKKNNADCRLVQVCLALKKVRCFMNSLEVMIFILKAINRKHHRQLNRDMRKCILGVNSNSKGLDQLAEIYS